MTEEEDLIINRVASSVLEVFDLEDYFVPGKRMTLDLSQWLWEGIVLREKEFRQALKQHDWTAYQDGLVAIVCSTDAIVPGWASILVGVHLQPYAKKIVEGDLNTLETVLYREILAGIDFEKYRGKPVIVKGCSHKPVPPDAYLTALQYLQPVAKSLMYGEACSAVPLYKQVKSI